MRARQGVGTYIRVPHNNPVRKGLLLIPFFLLDEGPEGQRTHAAYSPRSGLAAVRLQFRFPSGPQAFLCNLAVKLG